MPDSPNNTENLTLLLTQHQAALFRYIFSLLPREADARDILQGTSVCDSSTPASANSRHRTRKSSPTASP